MYRPEAPTQSASRGADAVRDPASAHLRREIRERLLGHYDRNRRDLPWRRDTDAYRVWISEVMLQQTRVQTVIPYYMRWMERFPDLDALALADDDEVLRMWEGLGYYTRARNLHRAARVVRERHGGVLPASLEGLRTLPGFGPYTAGAVASIAFSAPAPAVDGNVTRVLSRLFDLEAPSAAELRARAGELVDPARPGDFNQALMELGATVCTPRGARCGECPLAALCRAREAGTVHLRPARRTKKVVPRRSFAVAVILDVVERVLLVRRPRTGLLGGLWAFPEVELREGAAGEDARTHAALRRADALGLRCRGVGELPTVEHAFTHFRATYLPSVLRAAGAPADSADRRWADPTTPAVPLPTAQRRILSALVDFLD
jgi:A/G-specific adenine glycosylase